MNILSETWSPPLAQLRREPGAVGDPTLEEEIVTGIGKGSMNSVHLGCQPPAQPCTKT